MADKTAVITGASRGIGAAIALKFAQTGYNVVLSCLSSVEKAESVARECEKCGVEAVVKKWDVSSFAQCSEAVSEILKQFNKVDVLINNAGITKDGLLIRMSEEQFENVLDINLKSAFNMTRLIAPAMVKNKGGRIINISSVAGVSGNAGQVNYSASKAGLIGLTKAAAKELGARNITVNAVAPGFIDTDMTAVLSEDIKERALSSISLRRMGRPEDIANVVSFLASDDAGYITGQVILVDGGLAF